MKKRVEVTEDLHEAEKDEVPAHTGKEHWGEGGSFALLPNGKRVRIKEKE